MWNQAAHNSWSLGRTISQIKVSRVILIYLFSYTSLFISPFNFYISGIYTGWVIKLITWSQRSFTKSNTYLAMLSLLLRCWGSPKEECRGDQTFFGTAMHEYWLVCGSPSIKWLHDKSDWVRSQINSPSLSSGTIMLWYTGVVRLSLRLFSMYTFRYNAMWPAVLSTYFIEMIEVVYWGQLLTGDHVQANMFVFQT